MMDVIIPSDVQSFVHSTSSAPPVPGVPQQNFCLFFLNKKLEMGKRSAWDERIVLKRRQTLCFHQRNENNFGTKRGSCDNFRRQSLGLSLCGWFVTCVPSRKWTSCSSLASRTKWGPISWASYSTLSINSRRFIERSLAFAPFDGRPELFRSAAMNAILFRCVLLKKLIERRERQ